MPFSSRLSASLIVALVSLLPLGCEKKDPLAERKFQLLVEENGRLAQALGPRKPAEVPTGSAIPAYSDKAVATVTEANERMRKILEDQARAEALAANKVQREAIEKQVVVIRDLDFKEPVNYQVLNRKEIKDTISSKLAEVFSVEEFKHMADAMAAVGLIPANYPLRQKYIDLLGEQVAAFYDQHAHKLFMYSDATLDNAQNRVVLAHELTHALQDQNFGLKRLPLETKTNDDRAAAASALVEGDATLVMSEFMLKNMTKQMFKDSMMASFTQNMKQLETAPRFLREMLVFPYLRGQEFCAALYGLGGYEAVSKAYANPPSSTAQILHPQKYLANPREEPISVEWTEVQAHGEKPVSDNVVGEMGIRILLTEWVDAATAERAADGWRGDRYAYYGGDALLWKTVWANEHEAQEFFAAEQKLLEKRYHPDNAKTEAGRYEATGARVLRLRQVAPDAVVLIDAKDAEWADALEKVH